MSLRISFELSAKDVKHFREAMRKARRTVRDADEGDILDAAKVLFTDMGATKVPAYVRERIGRLRAMVDMLEDKDWRIDGTQRERVLSALVYFCDPEDLIPDDIPGLGFLDDAIMVELAFRELKHDIEGYQDFCEFRRKYDSGFRLRRNPETRKRKLEERQSQLRERIARRTERDREQGATQKIL